ncbi:hypothetical protein NC651_023431 [Populus alba x Populus x berolinensis]|nr:hypothetical protein NC651_023431 [Populus alba x Populus x berolinensis]
MVGLAPNSHSMAVGIPMAYRDHIRLHQCKLLPPWEISIVLTMARGSNGEFSAMGESLTKQCCVELYLPRAGREQSCAITLVDKIVRCQSVRAGSWLLKRHDSMPQLINIAKGFTLESPHHVKVTAKVELSPWLVLIQIPALPACYTSKLDQGMQGTGFMMSSKDFPDMHALIMHTYSSDNADVRVDHLGLHKALCVLMGWNYSKPPDNSKAYQFLPADEAGANQDDLIMWPPMVIIHNTITGKGKDGRLEGLGNRAMDSKNTDDIFYLGANLRRSSKLIGYFSSSSKSITEGETKYPEGPDLGFVGGKSKSLYGRDGHLGITLVKFGGDQSGLKEAVRLADHFEKDNRGREAWGCIQPLMFGKDDEKNPNLVKVDRSGEKNRILYGYLATVADLYKVDFETRKKVMIESHQEHKASNRDAEMKMFSLELKGDNLHSGLDGLTGRSAAWLLWNLSKVAHSKIVEIFLFLSS